MTDQPLNEASLFSDMDAQEQAANPHLVPGTHAAQVHAVRQAMDDVPTNGAPDAGSVSTPISSPAIGDANAISGTTGAAYKALRDLSDEPSHVEQ